MAEINEKLVYRKAPKGPTLVAGTDFPVAHLFSELAKGDITVNGIADEHGIPVDAVKAVMLEVSKLAGPERI